MKTDMTRREFLSWSTVAAVGAVAAACQPKPAPAATPAVAKSPVAGVTPEAKKVSLLFWDQFGEEATAVDEMVTMFNESQDRVEVKRESQPNMRDILKTSLSGGVGPDIVYYDTGPGFAGVLARAGLLIPLDDAYATYGWNDRFFRWTSDRTVFDGKTYGIGHELEFIGTFYNKRIFEEQGLAEAETHEDFLALCDKLKAAGLIPIAFADQDKWPAGHLFSVFSSNIAGRDKLAKAISAETPWNDSDFVEAIQTFFVDMNQAGYLVPDTNAVTYDDGNMLVYSGKAAMHITGTWMVEAFIDPETMPDPVGFFFYPSIHGETVAAPAGLGSGYFVSKGTKDAEACFEFLDFLMSEKTAKQWLEGLAKIPPFPVDPDDYNLSDLMRFCVRALQEHGEDMSYNIDVLTPDNFNNMMFDGFQEVLAGTKTAKQQADDLENAMQEAKAAGKVMDITP